MPVEGTDWMLTYLIREVVITDQISTISNGIIIRSVIQSVLASVVLVAMFVFIIVQIRKNATLTIAKETSVTENRVKQEEMQHHLNLQEKLLEEEKKRNQQDNMITAMSADYRSVYYVDLEKDEGICYRGDSEDKDQTEEGKPFSFSERFKWYAENFVDIEYRDGFLEFIDADNIRKGLADEPILAYRYLASAEQANKAKTVFLSNMSHEIRTPMNAIIGLDNIALNDPDTPEKTKDYLAKIGTSAEYLLALINDILDMSRIESGRMVLKNEEFSLSKLLESINTMFSGQCLEKGLDYGCHIKGDIDDYYIGDNMKLRQVLINILGNAVKFTPSGGKIGLTIERTARFDGRTTLQFEISDTGIGMSKEFLPHIFDTFAQEDATYTNKYGSSGLGLAITKNIVEMMNGNINVESEKGKGTTFRASVTLKDSDKKDIADQDSQLVTDNMSVLIIDDDPVACEHGRLVLEKIGIAADTALSGEEGIETDLASNGRIAVDTFSASEPGYYFAVLMDMRMPEMGGLELLSAIKNRNEFSGIPVIVLTTDQESEVASLNTGASDFIPKPYPRQSVVKARIRRAIELSEDRQIISDTQNDIIRSLHRRVFLRICRSVR